MMKMTLPKMGGNLHRKWENINSQDILGIFNPLYSVAEVRNLVRLTRINSESMRWILYEEFDDQWTGRDLE